MEARNPKSVEKETKPDQPTVDNRGRLFDNPFKYRSASKQRFARRFSKLPSSLTPHPSPLLPSSPRNLRPGIVYFHRPPISISILNRNPPFKFRETSHVSPGNFRRPEWKWILECTRGTRGTGIFFFFFLFPFSLREIFERSSSVRGFE